MTTQYCESLKCDILLFRVVEIQRICEATATPYGRCQPERVTILGCDAKIVRTIRGFDYRVTIISAYYE